MVQLRDLLAQSDSAISSGSVVVAMPTTPAAPIAAQLSIVSHSTGTPGYLEEEFIPESTEGTLIWRAAALDVKGSPVIALKDLSNEPQTVTIECVAEKSAAKVSAVNLAAGQVLLVSACDASKTAMDALANTPLADSDLPYLGAVGVSVSTNGRPGSLASWGFAVYRDAKGPFFSSLNFIRPSDLTSSALIFPGFPTATTKLFPDTNFHASVAIANFSGKTADVAVTLARTAEGEAPAATTSKVVLRPHSSTTVAFPGGESTAITNSVIVRSNLAPGEVIAHLAARGDSATRLVEMLAKDEQSPQNMGGHPWSVANGVTSTLLLFNHSPGEPKRFNVAINSGAALWEQHFNLSSLETVALDINRVITEQVKDEKGRVLPKAATSGQVTWYTRHATWGSGRLMTSDTESGMARSFSCGACAEICPGGLDPYTFLDLFNGGVGPLGNYLANFCTVSCTNLCAPGPVIGQYCNATYSWKSLNTSVATTSGSAFGASANFLGVAPGSTTGQVTATGDFCSVKGTGPITVTPTVTISGLGNIPLLKTGSTGSDSVVLTATGTPSGGTYSWSIVGDPSSVSIVNAESQSATIQSEAVGSATIQVRYTVNGQSGTATTAVKVQQPGSLGVITNTTPNISCTTVNPSLTYTTTDRLIQYQVLDTATPPAPIPASGMNATEILNVTANTCAVKGPTASVGVPTLSNGYFPAPDTLQLCSSVCLPANSKGGPSGTCMVVVSQVWQVNGFSVKSGNITYTCAGPPTGVP